ncbi:MAG TPA: SsrA-binding protein SmpB [Acidimicrobiia bacterium]|nr:SsrA-binding protein SmpB [Acidimicrobiia bacterium]
MATSQGTKTIATNRRARFDYEIADTFEAGLVLVGSEVKSLRLGKANLSDAYAVVRGGEAFLVGAYIAPYEFAREGGHDPTRTRKLLLHKREIERMGSAVAEKGLSLVPMRLFFKDGRAKIEIGLGKGKARYDKRETIKRRQADREMQRAMRHRSID